MENQKIWHRTNKLNSQFQIPAIFLDKDGTLIENVPNNVDPQLIEMKIGAIEGLQILSKAGYKLIVITNQSRVARDYFPESALAGVEARLNEILEKARHTIRII